MEHETHEQHFARLTAPAEKSKRYLVRSDGYRMLAALSGNAHLQVLAEELGREEE